MLPSAVLRKIACVHCFNDVNSPDHPEEAEDFTISLSVGDGRYLVDLGRYDDLRVKYPKVAVEGLFLVF